MDKARVGARPPINENMFLGNFAGAHKLGKSALALTGKEAAQLEAINPDLRLNHWGIDEAARALLLLDASALPQPAFAALVARTYWQGDSREQESWLRALSVLPGNDQHLMTAIDACRTNIIPVFEAICCENPYPWHCFPELNYNQMVLKALFLGVRIGRVMGLLERANPELSRMSNDYAAEREAAGRTVPVDIWLAMAPHAAPPALARVERFFDQGSPEHRFWAAAGLAWNATPAARALLEKQRSLEKEPGVLRAIEHALKGAPLMQP